MDLRQILRTIRANLVVAVVVFVICLGAGVGGAVIPAKEYKASVVLLALPSKTSNDPASDVTSIQVVIPVRTHCQFLRPVPTLTWPRPMPTRSRRH